MNRRESMKNKDIITQMIHKRSNALERSVKYILLEGLNRFQGANLKNWFGIFCTFLIVELSGHNQVLSEIWIGTVWMWMFLMGVIIEFKHT